MSVGGNIKRCREARGWTQKELADRLSSPKHEKLSRAAVAQWELGQTHPRHHVILQLAKLFDKSPSYFQRFGGDSVVPQHPDGRDKHVIPLLSWSDLVHWHGSAGNIDPMLNLKRTAFLEVSKDIPEKTSIAFTLDDDSMEPDFTYREEIIVDSSVSPADLDYVVVKLNTGEHLFRQYRKRGPSSYDLVACNPDWQTESVTPRRPAEILGVMIEHRRKRRAQS